MNTNKTKIQSLLVTFLACPRKVTQRRAPGEHSFPSCSVVLGAFRNLTLRAQTVRNASPSDSVACRECSHGEGAEATAKYGSQIKDRDSKNPYSAIRNPQSNGFSLIETVLTLVVLSIAAVGVLSVFTGTTTGSADPLLLSQAARLAQERMDTIVGDRKNLARGFAWVVSADYNTNALKYPPEAAVAGFSNFTRSVNIFCATNTDLNTSTGAPPCASGYAHVDVTVTWNGGADLLTTTTLFADYGTF